MDSDFFSETKWQGAETSENPLTVHERIILFNQNHRPETENFGPEIEYFFHELTGKKQKGLSAISKITASFLLLFLVILFPFVALLIKLSSSGPVIIKESCTGIKGVVFDYYSFRTTPQNSPEKPGLIGRALEKTHISKLPSCINILNGDINLFGPKTLPAEINNRLNNILTQYYKRFAVKPGLIEVVKIDRDQLADIEYAKAVFKKELPFILNPSVRKSIKLMF